MQKTTNRVYTKPTFTLILILSMAFGASTLFFTSAKIVNIRSGVAAAELVQQVRALPENTVFLYHQPSLAATAALQPEIGMSRFTRDPEKADIRIAFQSVSGTLQPLVGPEECLIHSTYQSQEKTIFGLPLRYIRQDWAFAIIGMRGCIAINS